jgi:pleiotropic regulator 1
MASTTSTGTINTMQPDASLTTTTTSQDVTADAANTSLKRARLLFNDGDARSVFVPHTDPSIHQASMQRRRRARVPTDTADDALVPGGASSKRSVSQALVVSTVDDAQDEATNTNTSTAGVLARIADDSLQKPAAAAASKRNNNILVRAPNHENNNNIPTPEWHAPWKLSTVLSSHLGWVRTIAMDPTNQFFATGSADRTIKIWNLPKACAGADDALQLTLTGHISAVRGLAFSDRHPYLFSAGEDKMVKCWDLETNQVIRHYHGHLSGIFCLALHPVLDLLVTGGRDAVARVWDMRTKTQVHCLTGHDHTVATVVTQSTHPAVITGSHDTTIKLWDLVAGKCMTTLTHHQKSIRAIAKPSTERTFVSGAADCLKKWQSKDGRFLKSLTGHKAVVNAVAVNDDGVLISGGDDGSMNFWDYQTGYNFQSTASQAQPGSLDAENGIMATAFDLTGTRLITGETDKSIKIWKQDDNASEVTHPIDTAAWRKKCIAEAKQRF